MNYRKLRKIFPGAYIFQRHFLRGLYLEGLIYGGKFAFHDWASLIVGSKLPFLLCFTLYLRAIFHVQAPRGLILGGAFFALPVWRAYIWRGLYMEGLIFGILRYLGLPLMTLNTNDRQAVLPAS